MLPSSGMRRVRWKSDILRSRMAEIVAIIPMGQQHEVGLWFREIRLNQWIPDPHQRAPGQPPEAAANALFRRSAEPSYSATPAPNRYLALPPWNLSASNSIPPTKR